MVGSFNENVSIVCMLSTGSWNEGRTGVERWKCCECAWCRSLFWTLCLCMGGSAHFGPLNVTALHARPQN